MNQLPYFIQITDKWSKRRFALRLKSAHEFSSLAMLLDYILHLSDGEIEGLIFDGRMSEAGRDDIEDFRAIAYDIDDRGNFSDLIEEIVFKQRGRTLQPDKGLKFEHRKTDKKGYADIFVADLILDRDHVPFKRNWKGYYKRKWDNNPSYKMFVENLVYEKYPERSDDVLRIGTYEDTVDFLKAIGERLHSAPYGNAPKAPSPARANRDSIPQFWAINKKADAFSEQLPPRPDIIESSASGPVRKRSFLPINRE